jgi:hypothetical protein
MKIRRVTDEPHDQQRGSNIIHFTFLPSECNLQDFLVGSEKVGKLSNGCGSQVDEEVLSHSRVGLAPPVSDSLNLWSRNHFRMKSAC